MSLFVVIGCSDDDTDPVSPPALTTLAVTDITETSAKSGGNITDNGGGEITTRGVVWSTEATPTIEDHSGITVDGKGLGIFQSNIDGLSAATTYFVRAYATNSAGTSYGNNVMFETIQSIYILALGVNPQGAANVTGAGEYQEGEQVSISAIPGTGWEFLNWTGDTDHVDDPTLANTTVTMPAQNISLTANFGERDIIYGDGVTDIDGNKYVTVIIGNQEWMAENLRVTRDANGNDITRICYNNNQINCELYGGLYTWHTVMNGQNSSSNNPSGVQGICPVGWHVPSDAEWMELINYVAAQGFPNHNVADGAGNALKSCRQVGSPLGGECNTSQHPRWDSWDEHHGFDEFGFSALPGGFHGSYGDFYYLGWFGTWWTSTETSTTYAWGRSMYHFFGDVYLPNFNGKANGFSLRCVRNLDAH